MRCLITYQPSSVEYSPEGLKRIDRNLKGLKNLPFTKEALRHEAAARAEKMSIQGVQPKVSARLNIRQGEFEIVDAGGKYILKPQSADYPELPENEDLTMRLAQTCGLEVPLHFLVRGSDDQPVYVIKRFDREGRNRKVSMEDFAQLSGLSRETKYSSSMETVVKLVEQYCTYPMVEKQKLLLLVLFSFIAGNEDMHLKNFSVISTQNKVVLSPVYDLLNTSIAIPNPVEEMALPLNAKKSRITRYDLIDYYGNKCLQLNDRTIQKIQNQLLRAVHSWESVIMDSFLSQVMQKEYLKLLKLRLKRLFPDDDLSTFRHA
ncbi:MAG: HipA domain-containing protein [Deltaproteobacteria bacterium]|nr:HipA domain-containing protein [Deltaproteobacteria bacterium]